MDFPMVQFVGNVPRNSHRNSEDHQFVGNVPRNSHREFPRNCALEKFRGRIHSEYSEEGFPRNIPRNESLGIFRGTCPSVYSESSFPRNF
ncbi:hypothetical protein DY000_02052198 [Brassica cretica]|uniref:Uncharacterized protein n=1 Tax=Brassica cretica TaxID=69181 RepID=A0ABQ7A8L1_BRACR|nr:hypothetical protein DY000_02052198 [Brassica cretica]